MEWIKDINCCHVAIIGLMAHIIGMIIIGRYVVKIKYKEAQLELRTKELEKKNGKELKKIEELEKEVRELKSRN
jgi:cell division protein FtsL